MNIKKTMMTESSYANYISEAEFNLHGDAAARAFLEQQFNTPVLELQKKVAVGSNYEKVIIADRNCALRIDRLAPQAGFEKISVDRERIFGESMILEDSGGPTPVWLVDNPQDAITILSFGYPAALVEQDKHDFLIEAIRQNGGTDNIMLLAFSNTESGRKVEKELSFQLEMVDVKYKSVNLFPYFTTAYEAFSKAQETFINTLISLSSDEILSDKAQRYYEENSDLYFMDQYLSEREKCVYTCIPTGIPSLDSLLDGGFYPGLYVFCGQSQMGKTTLLNQITSNIARERRSDILQFCLEMKQSEMISKALSAETYRTGGKALALQYRVIHDGTRLRAVTPEQRANFDKAVAEYRQYSRRIIRKSSLGIVTIDEIEKETKKYIEAIEKAPIVIVDYLQVVQSDDHRLTEKQIIDRSMLRLKKLSQDNNAVVIIISSLNRNGYGEDLKMSSMNGSSSIEYFADFAFGLQVPNGTSEKDAEKMLENPVRPAEIKVLKDRFCGGKVRTTLTFLASYNTFVDSQQEIVGDIYTAPKQQGINVRRERNE